MIPQPVQRSMAATAATREAVAAVWLRADPLDLVVHTSNRSGMSPMCGVSRRLPSGSVPLGARSTP